MVTWHIETDFFALAVFIALFIKSYFVNKGKTFEDKAFSLVMVVCGFSTVADIMSSMAMNNPVNWWYYQITMILYAITVPILAFLWVLYSLVIIFPGDKKNIEKRMLGMSLPFIIYVLICLANPFTGWMFSLSDTFEYVRGPLFYLFGIGGNVLYSICGTILVARYHKRITPKYNIIILITFYFSTCASLIVQTYHEGCLIVHATYAVVFLICDATIEEQRKRKLTRDIEEKNKELQTAFTQIRYEAEHDSLTGLYNRRTTFLKCRKLLNDHPEIRFDIIHIDIRRFRLFNAFYGDTQGDKLLGSIARFLETLVKEHSVGICGRIDGDVFCMMLPYLRKTSDRHKVAVVEFLKSYRADFLLEPAIGIYYITDKSLSIEAMFMRATTAAKESKSHQLKYYCVFNEKFEADLIQEQQIVNDMWDSVNKEQLQVYMQPKYSLKTMEPIGAEALIRWGHPKKGMISPGVFIPVFEKNGFIEELDQYVWEHVCQILKSWLDQGKEVLPISVNVSRISMYSTNTVGFLEKLIEKYKIPIHLLELELTESAYMDEPEEMKRQLEELRTYGFKILMDDFGSAYSSLNTLKELPFDYLKLDMKFLEHAEDNEKAKIIIASVVDMALKLGIPVISEGVETKEQSMFLEEVGCQYGQGFLYAKPMPVQDYENLIWK